MPFDGTTYKQTSSFTLTGLISWLKTQPPEQTYDYCDARNCLAAQFNTHCATTYIVPSTGSDLPKAQYLGEFDKVLELVAQPAPHTMIGALQRAWALR